MKSSTILLACAAMLCSAQAFAQAFVGGSLGQSDFDRSMVIPFPITSGNVDGKDNGFKLFGGYRFHRHFGAEVAYVDAGRATYSGEFLGEPVTDGRVEVWGYNLAALAILPISERFAIFGKLGVFLWESETSDVTAGEPFSGSVKGWDESFGVGASWRFTRNVSARAEWEQFSVGASDVSLISLGVQYSF